MATKTALDLSTIVSSQLEGQLDQWFVGLEQIDAINPRKASLQTLVNALAIEGPEGPPGAAGTNGREIILQANETHIQYRYVDELLWTNLVALDTLVGPAGPQGEQGDPGPPGSGGDSRKDGADVVAYAADLAIDFDADVTDNKKVTFGGQLTSITFAATRLGAYQFYVVQDATGGRTIPWPSNVKFKGDAEQPSAAPSSVSCFLMLYDGANFLTARIA